MLETVFALQAKHDASSALRESAQKMEQSLEKTDEQKKSFKDEADALETELGF